jgi:ABC-type uncharacterized transport system fused permease/ATPase subunit
VNAHVDGRDFAPLPPRQPPSRTAVGPMRSLSGLLTAYWRSANKREAWTLAIIIAVMSWFISKVGIWMAEAAGRFQNAQATYQSPDNHHPWQLFEAAALSLVAMVVLSVTATAVRHLFSETLHRKWRAWLNDRFTEATLVEGNTILKIQSNPKLDSIDQRQHECLKSLAGNAIGLAMGIMTITTAVWEVSRKLWDISTPIKGMEAFGGGAGFVLTLGVILPFALLCTWGFTRIGVVMRGVNKRFMEAEGAFRSELNTMFRRAGQITASNGEKIQKKVNRTLYADIDQVWHRNNVLQAGFMGLQGFYNMLSFQVVASVLALPAYAQGAIDFQTYVTTAALVGQLTNGFSWLINVTPAIASLKADAERICEYAEEIERAQDTRAYFRATGVHDFSYHAQPADEGIRVRDMELMHAGRAAPPFLSAPDLHFPAGSWTALVGQSGAGKTSFLNALMRQQDYGRAEVRLPAGPRPFYACQTARTPDLTLKQLVAGARDEDEFADSEIAAVLVEAGLGKPAFLRALNDKSCNGRPWERALSGGQKKRLILAQLLLHRPRIAFLDEVTAGLDPQAQAEFYAALKRACPETTVISVIHNHAMPVLPDGNPVYDHVAEIDAGRVWLRRFAEGTALQSAAEPEPARVSVA